MCCWIRLAGILLRIFALIFMTVKVFSQTFRQICQTLSVTFSAFSYTQKKSHNINESRSPFWRIPPAAFRSSPFWTGCLWAPAEMLPCALPHPGSVDLLLSGLCGGGGWHQWKLIWVRLLCRDPHPSSRAHTCTCTHILSHLHTPTHTHTLRTTNPTMQRDLGLPQARPLCRSEGQRGDPGPTRSVSPPQTRPVATASSVHAAHAGVGWDLPVCGRPSRPLVFVGYTPPLSIPLSFYIFAAILWARGWFVHCGTEVLGPLCPQGPTTGRRCWAHRRPGTPGGGAGPTSRAWLTAVLSASPSRTCPMSVTMTPQSTSASKGTPCQWGAMRPTPSSGRR